VKHDCGWEQGSWQCRGSHLKPEEKVPPSLRGVTETPRPVSRNVTKLPDVTKVGRPTRNGVAMTPAQRKAASRAKKAAK